MKASFGGAFHTEWEDIDDSHFKELYDGIGYVFVTLPSGETLQIFYNDKSRLFVVDVLNGEEGNEFVRCTVPSMVA